jgi:hypothetical protein
MFKERCFFTGMKINNATIRKYYTTILSKDCMSLILQAKYFHVACTSWDTLKWNIQALCNILKWDICFISRFCLGHGYKKQYL